MKKFFLFLVLLGLTFAGPVLAKPMPYAPKALIYSDRVPAPVRAQFIDRVQVSAYTLNIKPDWLMIVMNFETAGTFRASVKNKYSGAVGLIQFIPVTAARLGTNTAVLSRLNEVEQLEYVERYFKPYAGQMRSVYDVYIAVFAPAFLGRSDETVLYSSRAKTELGRKRYRYNRVLDKNQDGVITVADVKRSIKPFVLS